MSAMTVILTTIIRHLNAMALPKNPPTRIGLVLEYPDSTVRNEFDVESKGGGEK